MNNYKIISQSDAIYLDTNALAKLNYNEACGGGNQLRILVLFSTIKTFSSIIAFGEFVGLTYRRIKESKEKGDWKFDGMSFLYQCRQLMNDFEKVISRAEPTKDKFEFIQLAKRLYENHHDNPKLIKNEKTGDIWHLMAALELKKKYPNMVFFTFDKPLSKAAPEEGLNTVY